MTNETPTITLIVQGDGIDPAAATKSLSALGEAKPVEAQRGLGLAVGLGLKWILGHRGEAGATASKLVDWATRQPPGTQVLVQLGDVRIEVSNASQKDVAAILQKSIEAAREAARL